MPRPSDPSGRALGALAFIGRLPEGLQRPLLSDPTLRERLGLTSSSRVELAAGLAVGRDDLIRSAWESIVQGRPAGLAIADGRTGTIEAVDPDASSRLRFRILDGSVEAAHLTFPTMILAHPSADVRISAFLKLVPTLGLPITEHERWLGSVQARPLSSSEVVELERLLNSSPLEVLQSMQARLQAVGAGAELSLSILMPAEPAYYARLLPPPANSSTRTDYRDRVLRPFLAEWFIRAPALAVRLFLPLPLERTSSFADAAAAAGDAELSRAIAEAEPLYDPVSRLNALDLALAKYNTGREYPEVVARMIAGLTADTVRVRDLEGWDVYVLFSALLRFVNATLYTRPELQRLPAFWRALCAWSHAGHLIQLFRDADLDAIALAKNLIEAEPLPVAKFVDLIENPGTSTVVVSPPMIGGVAKVGLLSVLASHVTKGTAPANLARDPVSKLMTGAAQLLASGWANPIATAGSPGRELIEDLEKLNVEGAVASEVLASWERVVQAAAEGLAGEPPIAEPLRVLRNTSFLLEFSPSVQSLIAQFLSQQKPREMTAQAANSIAAVYPLIAELTFRLRVVDLSDEAIRLAEELILKNVDAARIWDVLVGVLLVAARKGDRKKATAVVSDVFERAVLRVSDREVVGSLLGVLREYLIALPMAEAVGLGRVLALGRARLS